MKKPKPAAPQVEPESSPSAVEEMKEAEDLRAAVLPSTDRLSAATDLVSGKFNLDETYHVVGFKDKGDTLEISLASDSFEVSVKIREPDLYGIPPAE